MNEAMTPKAAWKHDLSPFATRFSSLIGGVPVEKYARECGITESTFRSYLGGSMYPTIPDSTVAMVKDVVDHWFADGIYFMLLNGGHVIRRVQRKGLRGIDGGRTELQISVRSDNEAYEPAEVVLRNEALDENNVLAQTVW